MDGVPERRAGSAAPSGDFSLLRLVQERGAAGVPLCREFAEMMLVDIAADADPMVSSYAALELMNEPQTRAENVAASLLVSVARFVRDQQPDDETLGMLMRGAARYVARFESYLAERAC